MSKKGRGRDRRGRKENGVVSRKPTRNGPGAVARLQEEGHPAAPAVKPTEEK